MVGVKHLCGSKPMSGQLQWPMFKVNEGLRWLFIRKPLHSWWTPSANPYKHSGSSYTPFSSHPQGLGLKVITHWDPFPTISNQTLWRHIWMLTHKRWCVTEMHTNTYTLYVHKQVFKKAQFDLWTSVSLERSILTIRLGWLFVFLSLPADKSPHTTIGLWHTLNTFETNWAFKHTASRNNYASWFQKVVLD